MYLVPFDSIDEPTIQALVTDEVAEDRHLDFKRDLPGNGEGDRKEFLADVVSFANAGGGVLVFGVDDVRDPSGKGTGVAGSVPGLKVANPDQEQLRLEQLILSGTAPRVPGVRLKWVPLAGADPVLVLKVPASWASPHSVSLKGSSRFYSRNSKGKYQLDVHELRAAFVASEGLTTRVRDFRLDRLAKIVSGQTPARIDAPPAFIFHVLPLSAFSLDGPAPGFVRNVWKQRNDFRPPKAVHFSSRWNLDGVLLDETGPGSDASWSYAQVFRSGVYEFVEARFLRHCSASDGRLFSTTFEHLVAACLGTVPALRAMGVDGPLLIALSLLGVRGLHMATREGQVPGRFRDTPIDRDDLVLPEVLIDRDEDVAQRFVQVVDMVWQAAGFEGTPNRHKDGSWFPGGELDRDE